MFGYSESMLDLLWALYRFDPVTLERRIDRFEHRNLIHFTCCSMQTSNKTMPCMQCSSFRSTARAMPLSLMQPGILIESLKTSTRGKSTGCVIWLWKQMKTFFSVKYSLWFPFIRRIDSRATMASHKMCRSYSSESQKKDWSKRLSLRGNPRNNKEVCMGNRQQQQNVPLNMQEYFVKAFARTGCCRSKERNATTSGILAPD